MTKTTKIVSLAATVLVVITGIAVGITASNNTASSTTTGSISRTYSLGQCDKTFCFNCTGPIALDSLYINIDTTSVKMEGAKFAAGCTGTIENMTIITSSADGLKVAEGAHDITINGGSTTCLDKLPTLHQDAVQVQGGSNLAFNNMFLNCGRDNADLIDSNFFVNLSGLSTVAPDHVVCDHCWFGPQTAHTVNLQTSSDSGVRNSTICEGKYPRLSFTKATDAVNVVDENNVITPC